MLITLARTYLAPYKQLLVYVVLLQFVGTLGALYLPKLNADIIDKGVITGDTGYIIRTGGVMLGRRVGAGALLRRRRCGSAPVRRWVSAVTCARRSSTASARSRSARSRTSGRPA